MPTGEKGATQAYRLAVRTWRFDISFDALHLPSRRLRLQQVYSIEGFRIALAIPTWARFSASRFRMPQMCDPPRILVSRTVLL
jgi:hypothetical protein